MKLEDVQDYDVMEKLEISSIHIPHWSRRTDTMYE